MTNRDLHFPDLLNARDLGGCHTKHGQTTRWHSLLRTDDLCRLNSVGEQALLDYGVQTVIDLRWPVDAETHPNFFHKRKHRLHHQHISLLGQSLDSWRAISPHRPKELFNNLVLEHFQSELRTVLQAIAAAPAGGVLFHCVSGKDRTGVVAALLLALVEVETETIVQDYGLSTEKLREPYLVAFPDEQAATLERVRCPPEQIYNMLAYVDEHYGDVATYLHTIGVSSREISTLQERLVG
ncbi:MAG: tyrosine-protein phosphatase [Caldilineaceae bacterium]|nr:tyrosine-protein phosphatase [Caldilineaceae bacterium]